MTRLYHKKNPEQCQAPGCKAHGEKCILDANDGTAAEFEAVLCDDHIAEARSAGQ